MSKEAANELVRNTTARVERYAAEHPDAEGLELYAAAVGSLTFEADIDLVLKLVAAVNRSNGNRGVVQVLDSNHDTRSAA